MTIDKAFFVNFLDSYNECFYNRDIERLRDFYDTEANVLIYFDNHKDNDTFTVEKHLELVFEFFTKGKQTESGDVEPLIIEDLYVFNQEESACLCFMAKYKSFPEPAVRSTLYLECKDDKWKIIHAHYSFQPER